MGGQTRTITLSFATAFLLVMVLPSAQGDGVIGPDPFVNGDFTAAVPGTAIVPGWTGQSFFDPTRTYVEAVEVDGDVKVRTLGKGGYFGGPTNLGSGFERAPYSALFDRFTFELTAADGTALSTSGMTVMLLVEHWVDAEDGERTSKAIRWIDVSTAEAAAGLSVANADDVITFDGKPLPFDFTDEELANEFTMGGVKIALPHGVQLLLDDFRMDDAVVFGTY